MEKVVVQLAEIVQSIIQYVSIHDHHAPFFPITGRERTNHFSWDLRVSARTTRRTYKNQLVTTQMASAFSATSKATSTSKTLPGLSGRASQVGVCKSGFARKSGSKPAHGPIVEGIDQTWSNDFEVDTRVVPANFQSTVAWTHFHRLSCTQVVARQVSRRLNRTNELRTTEVKLIHCLAGALRKHNLLQYIYDLANHPDDVSTGQPDAHLRCEARSKTCARCRRKTSSMRLLCTLLSRESLDSLCHTKTKCVPASQMKEGLKDAVECVAEL